jgi:hypothetical protein
LSQDPLGLAAGENLYSFAPNAFGWVDPLGLTCKNAAKKPSIFAKDKYNASTNQVFPKTQSVTRDGTKVLKEKFLGDDIVKVGPGKWRSADGTRQFRLKPGDYAGSHGAGPHARLEFLKPNQPGTKYIVEKNVHIPIVD